MMIYDASVALGEAYIVVRADLRAFSRDLRSQLKKTVDDIEKDINTQLGSALGKSGEKSGEEAGDGVRKGFQRKLGDKRHSPWVNISAALASALDDGISALPTEVKAAIVGGILAAAPFVGAGLSGAIVAGIGAGVVGVGALLAAQYEPVRDRFAEFQSNVRNELVRTAVAFGPALIRSLDLVEDKFAEWEPMLTRIFSRAAPLLEELAGGAVRALEAVISSIDVNFDDIGGFVTVLADGIGELGEALAYSIDLMASTGDKGREAFGDMITLVASLVTYLGQMLYILVQAYDFLRFAASQTSFLASAVNLFSDGVEDADTKVQYFRNSVNDTNPAFSELIALTKDEEKAAKEAAKAIDDQRRAMDEARDAAFSLIDVELAYRDSIDELSKTLKENGDEFTFNSEKGRESIGKIETALQRAQARAEERFASGELNWAEARKLYQDELAEIYKIASAHGITKKELDKIFARTIDLINLPNPDPNYWNKQASSARELANQLQRAIEKAARLQRLAAKGITVRWGAGMPEGFADGDIVTQDSIVRVGEGNRPEVIIPLTKPARAAQLAEQSGLTRMLGGMGGTTVQVFVGDEPLEQKMYRVVQKQQSGNSRSLQYGPR